MQKINTIIFDLGGVLIDWNPKYVYREIFNGDEEKVNWFLDNICTMDWNVAHDAGRPLAEGTELLVKNFPQYEEWIRIYYDRWPDMLGGPITESVKLFSQLKSADRYNLLALTNWSAETFPVALKRYDFLQDFDGIVVSGEEKTRKPFPEIYEIVLNRFELTPNKSLFIDDNLDNVIAAKDLGINGIHFHGPKQLKMALKDFGVDV